MYISINALLICNCIRVCTTECNIGVVRFEARIPLKYSFKYLVVAYVVTSSCKFNKYSLS